MWVYSNYPPSSKILNFPLLGSPFKGSPSGSGTSARPDPDPWEVQTDAAARDTSLRPRTSTRVTRKREPEETGEPSALAVFSGLPRQRSSRCESWSF